MKSLKDYSMNLPEQDYHAYPAYSYSLIARYAKDGFSALKTLHDEPVKQTDSMRFGSLFDAMLTHENAADEYIVFEKDVPPARKAVLDRIAQLSGSKRFDQVPEDIIKRALEECDYKAAKKYETQFEHLLEYSDYYNAVKSGKQIVSQKEWDDAIDMMQAVQGNEYLKEHFAVPSTDEKEFLYQLQFCLPYTASTGKIEIKCMLDMVEVDHKNRTIQPWDIKTSADPAFKFDEQFVKFRYDIQANLYDDMLRVVISKDEDYRSYKVLPFKFMDISRSDKVPVVWEYDTTAWSQSDGLSFTSGDKTYQFKDYRKLLDEILEYEKSDAIVPKYISTTGPNDILKILNKENG